MKAMQRKSLISVLNMVILFCSVIAVEWIMSKQTMQQLTEYFKFSSRHGDVKASFSRRPILHRMGEEDENIVLI